MTAAPDRVNAPLTTNVIAPSDSARFHVGLLALSFAMMFVEGYDMQALAFAAPLINSAWGLGAGALGRAFGSGLLGYMIGATVMSGIADRAGRKRIVVVGSAWFAVWTLLIAFSANLQTLSILRGLAGLGLGAVMPAIIALNAEYAPNKTRSIRLTFLFVGYAIGGSLGGVLVAPVMAARGWPAAFYVGGVIPLALSAVLALYLPESLESLALRGTRAIRDRATVSGSRPEPPVGRVVDPNPGDARRRPLVRQLFTDGRATLTVSLWCAFVTSLIGHHFLVSWLPTILRQSGMAFQQAVVMGSLVFGGSVIGGPIIGFLVDRFGGRALAVAYLLSVPLVAAIGLPTLPPWILSCVIFLAGATLVGGQMGLGAMSASLYPPNMRSTGTGWAFGLGRIGAILGPVLGGWLLAAHTSLGLIFSLAAMPALICSVLIFVISREAPALSTVVVREHDA